VAFRHKEGQYPGSVSARVHSALSTSAQTRAEKPRITAAGYGKAFLRRAIRKSVKKKQCAPCTYATPRAAARGGSCPGSSPRGATPSEGGKKWLGPGQARAPGRARCGPMARLGSGRGRVATNTHTNARTQTQLPTFLGRPHRVRGLGARRWKRRDVRGTRLRPLQKPGKTPNALIAKGTSSSVARQLLESNICDA
jgi:hypothetical protein